jgi:hypothetical protein
MRTSMGPGANGFIVRGGGWDNLKECPHVMLQRSRWAWQRFPLTPLRLGAAALAEEASIVAAESRTEAVPIVAEPPTEAVPIVAESPTEEAATIAAAAGTPELQPELLRSALRQPQARTTTTTRSAGITRIRPANSQVHAGPRRIARPVALSCGGRHPLPGAVHI